MIYKTQTFVGFAFTKSELSNPRVDVSKLNKVRQPTDFEALK